jgi:glycosyltransferase involved in cell wall biosynthesis
VIPDIGGAREVVRDPSAGRIAEREPAAIAAAVRDLLADPPTQEAVAANAERFSWKENARQLVAFWWGLARR